jgi:hypothetical protein
MGMREPVHELRNGKREDGGTAPRCLCLLQAFGVVDNSVFLRLNLWSRLAALVDVFGTSLHNLAASMPETSTPTLLQTRSMCKALWINMHGKLQNTH